MALEGTLRDFSFADILQLISLQRKTGVLTLKNESDVVTISFLEGRVVAASSLNQHEEDRLGLILLKKGEVTEADLESALKRQEETLQRLGRILVEQEAVTQDDVREAMEQQMLQIIYRVFRWGDGEYHFSQETDIDYDRDLMIPMAADSIIMEGARMTDEWPFVDQRIPDRSVVFVKSDPGRKLEVEEADDDLEDFGFSFAESPDEAAVPEQKRQDEGRVSKSQLTIYRMVDGRHSISEIILESPFIEFDTCKCLVELLDRGLIRPASQEEVARQLRRDAGPDLESRSVQAAIPWLAGPFLVLLGFSLTIMSHNPLNPAFHLGGLWDRFILESQSWYQLNRLAEAADSAYFLNGLYPDELTELVASSPLTPVDVTDPWGRDYRLVTRGHKLMVTGADPQGQPVPLLILSQSQAWEGEPFRLDAAAGPGVILLQ